MFAIVDAAMSTSPSAPRCSRSGDSGDLVSVNGPGAADSLICTLPDRAGSGWLAELVGMMRGLGIDRQPAAPGKFLDVGGAAGPVRFHGATVGKRFPDSWRNVPDEDAGAQEG